jgi:hypothetical protein
MIVTKKNKTINIGLGSIGLFISLLLLLFFNEFVELLILFAEKYVSEDNSVKLVNLWFFQGAAGILIAVILLISGLFFIDFYSRVIRLVTSLFDFNGMHMFFIKDELFENDKLSKITLILSTASAIVLHLLFITYGIPDHEGYQEEITSLSLLVSGLILLLALGYLKKKDFSLFWYRIHQYTLVFLSFGLLFLYGEEINWGQRIFEIESNEVFQKYNFQNELSLHNFFNPLFDYVYPAVGMSTFLILVTFWLFYKGERNYYLDLFIPHKNLFFLIFWMACASYNGDSETYEEMVFVFFLLYSIRILFSLKNTSKNYHANYQNKKMEYRAA